MHITIEGKWNIARRKRVQSLGERLPGLALHARLRVMQTYAEADHILYIGGHEDLAIGTTKLAVSWPWTP